MDIETEPLEAFMKQHLGYGKHDPAGNNSGNSRNGVTRKKLKGDSASWKSKRRGTGTGNLNRN